MAKAPGKSETREERLAKALRANLRRRKAQDRARSAQEKPAETAPDGDAPAGEDKEKA